MSQLYKSKWIITSSPEGEQLYEDSAIVVDDGKIFDIVSQSEIDDNEYETVENFGNSVITAGFINLDTCLQYSNVFSNENAGFLTSIKRFFKGLNLFFTMLSVQNQTYPMYLANLHKEYSCMSKEAKIKSFKDGLKTLLLNGTTCFAETSGEDFYFDILCKFPVNVCYFIDLYSDSLRNSKKLFKKLKKKVDKFNKTKPENLHLGLYPHSVWAVHKKLWRILSKYSRRNNLLLMTGLNESKDDEIWLQTGKSNLDFYYNFLGYKKLPLDVTGTSAAEYLKSLGVLHKNFIVKNGNYLSESDLKMLSENDVKFSYSPRLNEKIFKSQHSFQLLTKYFEKNMGFATGSLPEFPDMNIAKDLMSVKSLLQKEELIKYITYYSAKVLGLENKIGSLELGKQADFNVFKLDKKQKYCDFEFNKRPKFVYIKGKNVVKNGEINSN